MTQDTPETEKQRYERIINTMRKEGSRSRRITYANQKFMKSCNIFNLFLGLFVGSVVTGLATGTGKTTEFWAIQTATFLLLIYNLYNMIKASQDQDKLFMTLGQERIAEEEAEENGREPSKTDSELLPQ